MVGIADCTMSFTSMGIAVPPVTLDGAGFHKEAVVLLNDVGGGDNELRLRLSDSLIVVGCGASVVVVVTSCVHWVHFPFLVFKHGAIFVDVVVTIG